MKFLLDVNASGAVSEYLQNLGHDVLSVRDVDPQMSDTKILEWANRDRRIIITTDLDFEQLVWQNNISHCGLLRLENLPRYERLVLLAKILSEHSSVLEQGAVVIATQEKIRIRHF
ncbi:MAG: hypothetical protein GC158_04915 [Cyanobacteria bacterium RI_101]|nr:hypothetical protein [Cyanobacteria bacterium RI_101]